MGRNPETMPPHVLCPYLATFMRELKKADGTDYEPDTINSIQGSIDRHLREQGYPYSITESSEFKMVKEVVEAKRKMLKASGKGNKPNAQMALTDEEVDQLWFQGGFGRTNPTELIAAVWFLFVTHFGLRAKHECLQCTLGDVAKKNFEGTPYLEMNERATKTRRGGRGDGSRKFAPKAWATGDDRCPVKYYDLYMALRPQGMNEPDSPFFLNVNHHPKEGNPARFISQAMGHNTMGEIMKKAGERAKLDRPVSNHAARKTTVQRLHQRRFSDSMVASFTGHKNPDSVRHYYVPSLKEQRSMGWAVADVAEAPEEPLVPQNPAPRPAAVPTEPRPPPAAAPKKTEVVVVEDDPTPEVSGGGKVEIDTLHRGRDSGL